MSLNLVRLKERIVLATMMVRGPLFTPQERDFLLDLINATPDAMIADGRAEVHQPPNYMGRIDHLWAALSLDDGGEGLCAAPIPGDMSRALTLPLIAADKTRLYALMPVIKNLARISNSVIRIAKFTKREDVEVIQPPGWEPAKPNPSNKATTPFRK